MQKNNLIQLLSYLILVTLITSFIIGCAKEDKPTVTTDKKDKTDTSIKTTTTGAGAAGKEIFYTKSKENNIACADCHSNGSNNDRPLTKYFSPVMGASKRVSTYHGKFAGDEVVRNAGGATVCWETYLRMKTPMTEEQISALNEYYASLPSGDIVEGLKYQTIALPVRDKTKLKAHQTAVMALTGDPVKGETKFNEACGSCHGENSNVKKVPSILEDFEGNVKSVVYNVRLGDGAMPFFKMEALTDQEIADIASFIMKKSGK